MKQKINQFSDQEIKVLSEEISKKLLPFLNKNNFNPFERPVDINELSIHTGYAKQTLYGKVNRNEIPFHKKNGKLHFLLSEINEWLLSKNNVQSVSEKLDQFLSKKRK